MTFHLRPLIITQDNRRWPVRQTESRTPGGIPSPGHPPTAEQPADRGKDLPDRKARRGRPVTEDIMAYAIFLAIAFVMLGVERLVHYTRSHHSPRVEGPRA